MHLLLSKLTSHCLKGKFTHCTHFTLHTSHYTLYIASSLLAFTLHPSDGSSDSDHYSASDVPCQDRYVTKGKLLWREAWAMRVLGLMKDEDSARNKNIRSTLLPSTFTLHTANVTLHMALFTLHTAHCNTALGNTSHYPYHTSHFTFYTAHFPIHPLPSSRPCPPHSSSTSRCAHFSHHDPACHFFNVLVRSCAIVIT